jgi:hypothetical protein
MPAIPTRPGGQRASSRPSSRAGGAFRAHWLLFAIACGAPADRAADDTAATAAATATDSARAGTDTSAGTTSPSLSDERSAMFAVLREAEFPIQVPGAATVRLRDGRYEGEPIAGGSTRARVRLEEVIALGDLNGDDRLDAVVPVVVDQGGSGTFTHLALAMRDGEAARPVVTVLLGDRIVVDSLRIAGDSVIAFTRERPAGAPMTSDATRQRTRTYVWRDGRLTEAAARAP